MRGFGVATLAVAVGLSGCAATRQDRLRLVKLPPRCADQTAQVYFEPWSAQLTREGRMVLDAAAAEVRACRISGVDVLGLADAVGAPAANLELSRKRAEAVTEALAAAGVPTTNLHLAAAGDAGALTPTGQAAPLRRRVEVTLHVARP